MNLNERFHMIHQKDPTQDFPGASVVGNPPANAGDIKTWVRSLGQEDSLEEGIATHSHILA